MDLNDQQKEFYGAMESTFRTPGWTLMVQGWTQERDQIPEYTFLNARNFEDVQVARARYGMLCEMIALAEFHAQRRQEIETATEGEEPYV